MMGFTGVIRILLNKKRPLRVCLLAYAVVFYVAELSLDSACWASSCTSSAVDASVSVDNVLAVSLRDCIYWTFASTGSAAYASVSNYVCHNESTSFI